MNASDLYEEWHVNYTGDLTLQEYIAVNKGWSDLQVDAFLAGVEYDGEGTY